LMELIGYRKSPLEAGQYGAGEIGLADLGKEPSKLAKRNPLGTQGPIVGTSQKFGRDVEWHLRGALGWDRLVKGESLESAISDINKYHFDYQDLSQFEKSVVKRVVPFYCVPEDHEILTKRGWLHHSDLVEGEDVMVLDPESHEMRWEPLQGVATFEFDGELRTFERRGGKFLFTEDHRWPVQVAKTVVKGKEYGGERKVLRAHELNSTHMLPLKGEFVDEGDSILSPRLAAILGWVVTDGYARWRRNHWEALVYQSPKKYLTEIESLLGNERRKAHPTTGVHAVNVKLEDKKAITKHYQDKDDLPSLVTHLSREAAEAMWDAMWKAEGCTDERSLSFSQIPGPVLEAFQILSYMTGRALWKGKGHDHYVRNSDFLRVKEGMGTEHYEGVIWCPQTPTGTWVMRHEGAVIPSGNTWTRRNVPLQFQMLVEKPAAYSHYFQAMNELQSGSTPEGVVPQYF
ncbi:MAG: hypothetical protein ACEQR4_07910, partial [Rhodoluna sp.]